ncbi:CocE/NonD family hydrolase [soil metagenome]
MRPLTRIVPLLAALVLAVTLLPNVTATAAEVYPGAMYREEYFPMGDALGTVLHADVLRSDATSWTARQPVVLVVSPYTNHNGATTDVDLMGGDGPNNRFYDFLTLTGALDEGYTYVQVDLPGNGGSSGCNDWGGPVEQGAVKAAVEWSARQPWSTGRVALLGKSYDAWTGLMGMAQDPIGLAAVISMEPVFSGYRYLFNDGVRFSNSVATPALFQVIDAKPGALNDDPEYHVNGAPQAYCYGLNIALQQQDSEDVAFWAARDMVRRAAASDVPLFLTQGFLETNTKPDAALAFWNALDHSHGGNRAWFGQFDHVRGWDRRAADGRAGDPLNLALRSETGREDFAEQVLVFLDEHLKGITPAEDDVIETIAVQDNLGRYREEQTYPAADTTMLATALTTGTYTDSPTGGSLWTVSQPMPHDVWLAGEPVVGVDVTTLLPRGNLVVNVYDHNPATGRSQLIHRGTTLLRRTGAQTVDVPLYAQDWVVAEGHRIVVQVVGNDGFWVHTPSLQTVTVRGAEIALPFLTEDRTDFIEGGSTPRLEQHLGRSTAVPATALATQTEFALPGPIETGERP